MKVYISLPISGCEEQARVRADMVKIRLSKQGYEVVNPFDIPIREKHPDWYDYMSKDLRELDKCDAIYMCVGWDNSYGCKLERFFAEMKGKKVILECVHEPEKYWR